MNTSVDLKRKVGQLFMFGFVGTDNAATHELIEEFQPGGVILFQNNCHNAQQIRELTDRLQQVSRNWSNSGLLIAMDQEGGRIRILPDSVYGPTPSNAELGNKYSTNGNLQPVSDQARATGRCLRSLGINMNFAPVLDVVDVSGNEVIGDRSYGADPDAVSRLGCQYIKILQQEGVIATAKHYPGHGHTAVDSHKALPFIDLPAADYESIHLAPFRNAIDAGVGAVMTAHIVYPALDSQPATLSPELITGQLRSHLGFDGVVVTDDMNMLAIADNYTAGQAAVAAVNAGVDLLLYCRKTGIQREARDAVCRAVENGTISIATLDSALGRITRLKAAYGLS